MAKYIPIEKVMASFKQTTLLRWLDRMRFTYILIIWLLVVACFGLLYWFTSGAGSYLEFSDSKEQVTDAATAIYFSFVTATTTGFGDVIPYGFFKVVAILEVVFGLLLLAVVTSKLVSIKQDAILEELYELSFTERINHIRASLLLFRQNIDRIVTLLEEKGLKKRDLQGIILHISSFEDTLSGARILLTRPQHHLIRKLDVVNLELICTSIINSLEKFHELLLALNLKHVPWKTEITVKLIEQCFALTDSIFHVLDTQALSVIIVKDLKGRKDALVHQLRADMEKKIKGSLAQWVSPSAKHEEQKK